MSLDHEAQRARQVLRRFGEEDAWTMGMRRALRVRWFVRTLQEALGSIDLTHRRMHRINLKLAQKLSETLRFPPRTLREIRVCARTHHTRVEVQLLFKVYHPNGLLAHECEVPLPADDFEQEPIMVAVSLLFGIRAAVRTELRALRGLHRLAEIGAEAFVKASKEDA